jgi:hypothetical protein
MGKVTGFMEIDRQDRQYEPVAERLHFYKEFIRPLPDAEVSKQGARCMDCGIPSARTVARSTTSFLTGTIWCTTAIGAKRCKYFTH